MKLFKNTMLWVVALVALFIILPMQDFYRDPEDIHTRRFCAYGHVYVEFERAGKTWGTTFLDSKGRPTSCDGDMEKVYHGALES